MILEDKQKEFYHASIDNDSKILKSSLLYTKLGSMLAISDEDGIYLLEFVDKRGLEREIERLRLKLRAAIIPGVTDHIRLIDDELKAYFDGALTEFKTTLHILGSPFQKLVWQKLLDIPYGETRSYGEQAASIEKPSAYRAVANANGANQIAIIIPCHRIIKSDGNIGGYGGGVERKQWVINHEAKYDK